MELTRYDIEHQVRMARELRSQAMGEILAAGWYALGRALVAFCHADTYRRAGHQLAALLSVNKTQALS